MVLCFWNHFFKSCCSGYSVIGRGIKKILEVDFPLGTQLLQRISAHGPDISQPVADRKATLCQPQLQQPAARQGGGVVAILTQLQVEVAVAAVQLGFLLSGSVIVESIFALNGVGYLAFQSIVRIDFPVVQSILVFLACTYILLTLIADLINARLDPRVRLE